MRIIKGLSLIALCFALTIPAFADTTVNLPGGASVTTTNPNQTNPQNQPYGWSQGKKKGWNKNWENCSRYGNSKYCKNWKGNQHCFTRNGVRYCPR